MWLDKIPTEELLLCFVGSLGVCKFRQLWKLRCRALPSNPCYNVSSWTPKSPGIWNCTLFLDNIGHKIIYLAASAYWINPSLAVVVAGNHRVLHLWPVLWFLLFVAQCGPLRHLSQLPFWPKEASAFPWRVPALPLASLEAMLLPQLLLLHGRGLASSSAGSHSFPSWVSQVGYIPPGQ